MGSALATAMVNNDRRRAAALDAGEITFVMEIVEDWTACTQCARLIKVPWDGKTHQCGCPGVTWQQRDLVENRWTRKKETR